MSADPEQQDLKDVTHAVDGLVVLIASAFRRYMLVQIAGVLLLVITTGTAAYLLVKTSQYTRQLDALAAKLEELAFGQEQIGRTTEVTKTLVDDAASIEADKPTIEILPSSSSSAGAPKAVVVLKPSRRPMSPSARVPNIELPVKIPVGVTVVVPSEDAGAPPPDASAPAPEKKP